ncbi:myocardin-like isoform X1 [Paramuricea clavata]|uniref:Myocardin-like isoform X1 n=1 Tax=Paramuricea clavata TaxID=317549 RepID=A0A6S7J134_PARCT|nr:myocardin-like isoform X1 [Paramuricea clavata]
MEENASSTENLVFAHTFDHEQLQNNREVLARRLQLRRPREELVNQGIMPAVSAAPIILQQKSKLERARKSDILQRKIRVRPDRSQLIQRHILEGNVTILLQEHFIRNVKLPVAGWQPAFILTDIPNTEANNLGDVLFNEFQSKEESSCSGENNEN